MKHAFVIACLVACGSGDKPSSPAEPKLPAPAVVGTGAAAQPATPATPPAAPKDPSLAADQEEYVADILEFTKTTHEQVRERMKKGSEPLKEEWNTWEKEGKMTPDRITKFYKQTTNYIYELGEWHLFVPNKRESDLALVELMRTTKPKNILDFGGGVGLMAVPLAKAGFDVTLADVAGTSLEFAQFRAKRHGLPMKFWKADLDAAPPDAKYDVILCLDVLEHLPKEILHDVVDKLVKLKHKGTQVIMSAPFGRTSVHPMHMDNSEDTQQQVHRLQTELPPGA
jgi:2-polyprenyl-3-methyl-5-hydroxy-6-metoxy-1,4-benzoquinol methylase